MFLVISLVPFLAVYGYLALNLGGLVPIPGSVFMFWLATTSMWLLLVLPAAWVVWTDYYLDTLVVTSRRVISIEQKGLFARETQSFSYDRIQDIVVEVNGIIPTLLDFGTLHIQTAGAQNEFRTHYVPQPESVKSIVFKEYQHYATPRGL